MKPRRLAGSVLAPAALLVPVDWKAPGAEELYRTSIDPPTGMLGGVLMGKAQ